MVTEKMEEHGIHYLPCSGTSDVIYLLSKVLGTTAENSKAAMATDLWRHLTCKSRGAWHTLNAMLLLNYK